MLGPQRKEMALGFAGLTVELCDCRVEEGIRKKADVRRGD